MKKNRPSGRKVGANRTSVAAPNNVEIIKLLPRRTLLQDHLLELTTPQLVNREQGDHKTYRREKRAGLRDRCIHRRPFSEPSLLEYVLQRAGRLRAALRGQRETGAQMLEVAVWGYDDDNAASQVLQRQLAQIIRLG
jgi:hypothetical protein